MLEKLQALIAGKTGNIYAVPSALIRETLVFVKACEAEREQAQRDAAIQARAFSVERAEAATARDAAVTEVDALHSLILSREAEIAVLKTRIDALENENAALQVKLENTQFMIARLRR